MRYPAVIFLLFFLLGVCSPAPTPTPSTTPLPSATRTNTATVTRTPLPTWTFVPTKTPTPTLTPTFTFTPTPSETPAPLAPAGLFPFYDADGRVIDWSYAHLSDYTTNEHGDPVTLSGFLAFQLMDRAVHHETITFDSQILTVYYLSVQHTFNGKLLPVKLILSAAAGQDVPLSLNPAGGGAYVRLRILPLWDRFDGPQSHLDANKPYTDYHSQFYPDVLLVDLQSLLPALPPEMIVLAESQIIFDLDRQGYQVKYNLDTVPYLAARFMPFLAVDDYDRVTGPSPEAESLVDHLINQTPIPGGIPYFSSDILVLIPRTGQIPTLP